MSKRFFTVLFLCIFFILTFSLLFFLINKKETKDNLAFNKIELTKKNFVNNFTKQSYIDTIILTGLDLMDIDSITVIVYPLSESMKTISNTEVQATIVGQGNIYMIFIDNLPKNEIINILAHELIHLKQYYEGNLKLFENNVIWKNEFYDFNEIDYINRPWEIEAMVKEDEFSKRIRKKLYE